MAPNIKPARGWRALPAYLLFAAPPLFAACCGFQWQRLLFEAGDQFACRAPAEARLARGGVGTT